MYSCALVKAGHDGEGGAVEYLPSLAAKPITLPHAYPFFASNCSASVAQ